MDDTARYMVVMGLTRYPVDSMKEAKTKEELLIRERARSKERSYQPIRLYTIEQWEAKTLGRPIRVR